MRAKIALFTDLAKLWSSSNSGHRMAGSFFNKKIDLSRSQKMRAS